MTDDQYRHQALMRKTANVPDNRITRGTPIKKLPENPGAERFLVDKINELVDAINKLNETV